MAARNTGGSGKKVAMISSLTSTQAAAARRVDRLRCAIERRAQIEAAHAKKLLKLAASLSDLEDLERDGVPGDQDPAALDDEDPATLIAIAQFVRDVRAKAEAHAERQPSRARVRLHCVHACDARVFEAVCAGWRQSGRLSKPPQGEDGRALSAPQRGSL